MASAQSTSLPLGFSVYQPALGAPLQFFPALGTQELDDLINSFNPDPISISEKRANISVNFFEEAQITGQTYKFYAVHSAPSSAASPTAASPSIGSGSSLTNASPFTPSWDWSATPASSLTSANSRASTQHRNGSTARSRHRVSDMSDLPGMRILTKDGQDVTHSASRGSRTKAQRDHAHLMRIIKACDSCRSKKIRCDPAHKKRGASQAATSNASKPAKKTKTAASRELPPCPSPVSSALAGPQHTLPSSSVGSDQTLAVAGLESFAVSATSFSAASDPFEEFMQFPSSGNAEVEGLLDFSDFSSSQSNTVFSTSTSSPLKSNPPFLPQQQQIDVSFAGDVSEDKAMQNVSPTFPRIEPGGSLWNYTDFTLYSPESSFFEDEHMQSLSTSQPPTMLEQTTERSQPSHHSGPDGEPNGSDDPGLSVHGPLWYSVSGSVNRGTENDDGRSTVLRTSSETTRMPRSPHSGPDSSIERLKVIRQSPGRNVLGDAKPVSRLREEADTARPVNATIAVAVLAQYIVMMVTNCSALLSYAACFRRHAYQGTSGSSDAPHLSGGERTSSLVVSLGLMHGTAIRVG